MQALLSVAPGGPETLVLADIASPTPGPGELLVQVRACAINYPDVLIIEDRYQYRPPRPFSPGSEVAGVVAGLGAGVTGWAIGDRVIGHALSGGLAEQMLLPEAAAYPLPDARSFTEGAALLFTYATSYHALVDRGGLRAGETLLVLGAAGGVGLAAVELGHALGARVVAAVSSAEKAAAATQSGADAVLIYGTGPFDPDQSRALTAQFKQAVGPGGADVIYDPVGGAYAQPALRSIAWGGRYLVVGFPAGIPQIPMNLVLLKSCDIRGVAWGAFAAREPAANRAIVEQLFTLWQNGSITPRVTRTLKLADAAEAITAMAERRAIGKLVVTISA